MKDTLASSTERILALLELFLARPEGVAPPEIQAETGIPRSSLYATLAVLKELGYLDQSETRGRYRAGARLQAWRGSAGDFRQDLLAAFHLETTRLSWPETLILVVPVPAGHLVYGQTEGHSLVRSVYRVGEAIDNNLAASLVITNNPDSKVLANGYSLVRSPDTLELAVPVCPDGCHPQAAVLLSIPAFRADEQETLNNWLPELRVVAAHLSYRLGALSYQPFQPALRQEITPALEMSPAEIDDFLRGPWTARLACIRPDGQPHVIPVWQEWDGKSFTLIAWQGSAWAEFVRGNPQVSLTIDEPWPPLRRLAARGKVSALPYESGSAVLNRLTARLTRRYLGETGQDKLPGRVQNAFRVEVETLRGWQGLPGNTPPHRKA